MDRQPIVYPYFVYICEKIFSGNRTAAEYGRHQNYILKGQKAFLGKIRQREKDFHPEDVCIGLFQNGYEPQKRLSDDPAGSNGRQTHRPARCGAQPHKKAYARGFPAEYR